MNNYSVPIVATVLLIGYILLDQLVNESLWNASKNFTVHLQEHDFTGETGMFNFFTYLVFVPPLIVFLAFIAMDCKLNVIIYMVVVLASVGANELLKNIYHQPRPYMTEPEITPYACNADYGKPSGHAQNSLVMMMLMPLMIFPQLYNFKRPTHAEALLNQGEDRSRTGYTIDSFEGWNGASSAARFEEGDERLQPMEQSNIEIAGKVGVIFVMCASLFMTGLSRVYLGVHSIGQVLLGWVFGAYILVIYIWVVRKPLRFHCMHAFHCFRTKQAKYNWCIPVSLLMLFILVCVAVLFLELNIFVFVSKEEVTDWLQQVSDCQGGVEYTSDSPMVLYNGCFATTLIVSVVTGIIVGAFLSKGRYHEGHFYKNLIRMSPGKIAMRLVVLIGEFIVLIPFAFIRTQNVYIQGFCQILPVGFITGLILTMVYPYLCHRLKIQVKGDIFELGEDQSLSHLQVHKHCYDHIPPQDEQNKQVSLENRHQDII